MPVTLRPVAELAGAQRASFASFLLLGHLVLCSIAWVPEYIDRLGVSFAQWGVILGLAPIGALSAVITAPFMINRFGTSPVMRVTALLATVALVPLGFVTNAPLWTVLNTLFNFSAGLTGVAVNTHGVLLQKKVRESILSGLHAGWSIGAVAAAASGGIATLLTSLEIYLITVALFTLAGFLIIHRFLLKPHEDGHREEGSTSARRPLRALPPRIWLLAFGLLCAVTPELAVFEWSAVLSRSAGADVALRALPFATFMVGMIVGRLSISTLTRRFDVHSISVAGALASGISVGLGVGGAWVLSPLSPLSAILWLAGFWSVAGMGLAPVGPTMISTASSLPGIMTTQAIAVLSFVAQSMSIVAKVVMGAIAEGSTVFLAFSVPFAMLLLGAIIANRTSTRVRARDIQMVPAVTGPLPVVLSEELNGKP